MAILKEVDYRLCRRIVVSVLDLMRTEAKTLKGMKSSSFQASSSLPRIRATPIPATRFLSRCVGKPRTFMELGSTRSLHPLVSARMTSHLTNNVRSFCKMSRDTSHGSSKTPEESETPNAMLEKIDALEAKRSSESDVESPEDEPSSENNDNYPMFNLNDATTNSDQQIVNILNEYNSRNHDIVAEEEVTKEGKKGVLDEQIGNLWQVLKSVSQISKDENNKK